jgi:hypothetical protein
MKHHIIVEEPPNRVSLADFHQREYKASISEARRTAEE